MTAHSGAPPYLIGNMCIFVSMKSLKVYSLVLLFFATASFTPSPKPTEELKWVEFNEGYTLGKKKKKIVMIDCYTEWCGWCKRMDHDTYSDANVQKKIYENFVPVKLNPELNQTYTLDGKQYNGQQLLALLSNNTLSGYPTIIFIIPNGKTNLVELSVGYSNAADFSRILDEKLAKKK
jgi:thioredoxin-related protein